MTVDFRKNILNRLESLSRKKLWLSERLSGKVTRSAIYSYLREKRPTEIGADKLEAIFEAIEREEKRQAKQK